MCVFWIVFFFVDEFVDIISVVVHIDGMGAVLWADYYANRGGGKWKGTCIHCIVTCSLNVHAYTPLYIHTMSTCICMCVFHYPIESTYEWWVLQGKGSITQTHPACTHRLLIHSLSSWPPFLLPPLTYMYVCVSSPHWEYLSPKERHKLTQHIHTGH